MPTPRTPKPTERTTIFDEPEPWNCDASLVIHKFMDRDRDGRYDVGEPMLSDVPFDIVEVNATGGDRVHQRRTDAAGLITITFDHRAMVQVRELLREVGGLWTITTPHRRLDRSWYIAHRDQTTLTLECDEAPTELWVGNARPFLPETGRADGAPGTVRRAIPRSGQLW